MSKLVERLTFANVMSVVALFVAIGGVAYAAGLARNSVKSKQIKAGAVKTAPGGADLFFNKGLSLDVELETHEKCILLGALKRANGVQKRAAEILGINYRSLRHRLEKYDLLNSKSDSPSDQQ